MERQLPQIRQQHVIDWLATSGVDVLCLQELKLTDDKFPVAELEAAGYKSWYAGQKTYNGVGILVRSSLTSMKPRSCATSPRSRIRNNA